MWLKVKMAEEDAFTDDCDVSILESNCSGPTSIHSTSDTETVGVSASNSDDDTNSTTSSVVVNSLLDVLKSPTPSSLHCKRSVASNKPPRSRVRLKRPKQSNNPSSVSPLQRAKEFKEEKLTVSSGKLFGQACREEVSLKISIIKNHIASAKHQTGKERLTANKRQTLQKH